MPYDVNLNNPGLTYKEMPDPLFTVQNGQLVEDTQHACTLYILSKENGSVRLQEIKGLIILASDETGALQSARFVPSIFVNHMARRDSEGKLLTTNPTDDLGNIDTSVEYPVYATDENGLPQYYGLGRAVDPTPGVARWGCIWTDWSVTREEVVQTLISEEEKYLLDGYRPQHVIEQNIDALGRALNNPMPPYIPTQTS